MPFVQVNDVQLHYEMEGSGPPLLMIAGTGSSDKPDMNYSTRMFAADAVGLLQALDIAR